VVEELRSSHHYAQRNSNFSNGSDMADGSPDMFASIA
jgi:hypothetical protein